MEEKERYEYFFGTNTIKDNKTNQFYGCVVDLLNQQDKRIKELGQENKQLKQQLAEKDKEIEKYRNAIVPKFKVGQEIYIVCDFNINRIVSGWKIADYEYYKQQYIVENKDSIDWIHEDKIFATKEEAEQKLAEVKGEKYE